MLIGEKIVLRPLKASDIEKTLRWRNNIDLIMQTQGIRFPKTQEMEEEWFKNVLNDKSNRNIFFAIDEINTNNFIGIVQLNNIDWISKTAIRGIVIGDQENRGKGYGKEVSKLLFNYAFNILNLRKICFHVISFNKASRQNLEKYFKCKNEGCLKKHVFWNNEYHDVFILSLFKDDFNRQ